MRFALLMRPSAAVMCLLFASTLYGQTPTGNSVLARYAHVQFKPEVLSGRIVGKHLRHGRQRITQGEENLTVQSADAAGKMELVYDGMFAEGPLRGQKLKIVMDNVGVLEIESGRDKGADGQNNGDYMRFIQRPGEPISFAFADSGKHRTVRADTIWEILIAYPGACRRHLLPVLYKLRPGWGLLLEAQNVKSQLLQMAAEGSTAEQTHWQELVDQLGHDSYSRREAADRRLRAAGRRVAGFLRNLDKSSLDAEQRFRVSRIIREYTGVEQAPREIAEELRDDAAIWLALAKSDKEPERITARAELQRLLKQTVAFDPSADPKIRDAQIEEIRKQIAD